MKRYTFLLAELCFYLLVISSFANGENLSIPMPKYKPKHGTNIKTRDDLSPQSPAGQPDESDNVSVSSMTTPGDIGKVTLEEDTTTTNAVESTDTTPTTTTTIPTTTIGVAPQVDHNVSFCYKSVVEILETWRIFFMNPAEELTEREILTNETASNETILFLDQIGYMLNCSLDGIQEKTFPAHYSYENLRLTDVYVAIRKRESLDPLPDDKEHDGDMKFETRNNLIFEMLEHYLSRMPRSHYGYEAPDTRDTPACFDEAGYITVPLGEANTCFSIWMARNGNGTFNINESYVDYYGGQLAFNRVDQDVFVMPDNMSIPQYFYSNNKSCFVVNHMRNSAGGEPNNSCQAFISADIYAMLCCCYDNLQKCHFPNPRSIHYRNVDTSKTNDQQKDKGFSLSCAVGNLDYAGYVKREEQKNWTSNATFLKYDDDYNIPPTDIIGKRCKIEYTFVGNDSNNFKMSMSAADNEHCPQLSSSQFLCERTPKMCPTKKHAYGSKFEVICCCGGVDKQNGMEKLPENGDLCNLDFLSHKVQDQFEDVFSTQPCSYSKHFHRLFGVYKHEKLYCVVQYDVALNQNMSFLDGNNFQLMFDKDARSHRDYNEVGHLVFGKVLSDSSHCSENDPYPTNMKFREYRAIYLQKCDPAGQNECDTEIERNISAQFEMNKDKVMRKCLKFATNNSVASKVQLQEQLGQNKQYIHADAGFMCYASIQSTITWDYLESANISIRRMYHKIEAGPITEDHIGDEDSFYDRCISVMEKFNDNLKANDQSYDYCEFTHSGKANPIDNLDGTLDGKLFCCCFVGYGWDHCNIEKRIVNYVDGLDVYRDNHTIKALLVEEKTCKPSAIPQLDSELVPEKDKLEKCARRQGCFQIRDVMNLKAKRITRFEIWVGCTSHIDKFALYSARSRLGYLCTTPDMEKVAKYGTKCLAVETGNYFSMTLFPPVNRSFYEDVEKTAKISGEKIENYLVICCCAQACDDKEAKKYAEYYLYRKE